MAHSIYNWDIIEYTEELFALSFFLLEILFVVFNKFQLKFQIEKYKIK